MVVIVVWPERRGNLRSCNTGEINDSCIAMISALLLTCKTMMLVPGRFTSRVIPGKGWVVSMVSVLLMVWWVSAAINFIFSIRGPWGNVCAGIWTLPCLVILGGIVKWDVMFWVLLNR